MDGAPPTPSVPIVTLWTGTIRGCFALFFRRMMAHGPREEALNGLTVPHVQRGAARGHPIEAIADPFEAASIPAQATPQRAPPASHAERSSLLLMIYSPNVYPLAAILPDKYGQRRPHHLVAHLPAQQRCGNKPLRPEVLTPDNNASYSIRHHFESAQMIP
jgi:hypothetical protein